MKQTVTIGHYPRGILNLDLTPSEVGRLKYVMFRFVFISQNGIVRSEVKVAPGETVQDAIRYAAGIVANYEAQYNIVNSFTGGPDGSER